jgi:hypothetical protein
LIKKRKPEEKEKAMENVDTGNSYMPPVDKLLTYGEARDARPEKWPNYLELELGPEHIPELIRMATDANLNWAESTSLEVWAPTHAWRALGQLRAEAAIEPLLSLFGNLEGNDWVVDEVPEVLGVIGPVALPVLARSMEDDSLDEDIRFGAISSIDKLGTRWPEARPECVALLTKQLELFAKNDPEINGYLVEGLVKLKAMEAVPLMEQAFAAERVDETLLGDWEDVQVELGLKSWEEVEEEEEEDGWHVSRLFETPIPAPTQKTIAPQAPSKEHSQREAKRKKAKSKMADQSRKKNRKR